MRIDCDEEEGNDDTVCTITMAVPIRSQIDALSLSFCSLRMNVISDHFVDSDFVNT